MKITAILFAALASVAVAQQQYTIDPASVTDATRNAWCFSQTTQCPLICLQLPGSVGANANTCNSKLLQYNCVCTNGQTPNITEYTQTLPWYICTTWQEQCVANCGHDNNCALACRTQHPCGALTPKKAVTSSSAAASATGTVNGTSASTTAAAQTTPTSTIAAIVPYTGAGSKTLAIEIGQTWGLGLVVAGLFGSFAILL